MKIDMRIMRSVFLSIIPPPLYIVMVIIPHRCSCRKGFLQFFYHKSVAVAVNVHPAEPSDGQPCFGIALGIQLDYMAAVGGDICHK